jgi:hypothetical protein
LDPAIIGTTGLLLSTMRHIGCIFTDTWYLGILKSIKKSAPTVKRVVITSSFASILDGDKGASIPDKTYSEVDWNPITEEQATKNAAYGYRGMSPSQNDHQDVDEKTKQAKLSPRRRHGNSKRLKSQTSL